MLGENHVMQVLYKKISQHDKIMLCKALYKEDDMCMPKKNHVMENHVRLLGIAVIYLSYI